MRNRFWPVATTLFFPGFAQGLVSRRRRMALWAVGAVVAGLLCVWTVWALAALYALRFAGAVDGFRCLTRAPAAPSNHRASIVAIVIGALGIGFLSLTVEAFYIPSSAMAPTLEIGDHIFVDKLTPRFLGISRGEIIVFAYPCKPNTPYIKRVVATAGDTVEVRCSVVYINGAAIPSTLVEGDTCEYPDREGSDNRWTRAKCSRYRESLGSHTYDVLEDPARPARDRAPTKEAESRDFPVGNDLPSCAKAPEDDAKPDPRQAPGTLVETKPASRATACEPQLHYVVPPGHVFALGDNRPNSNDSRVWGSIPLGAVTGRVVGIWLAHGQSYDWSRLGAVK